MGEIIVSICIGGFLIMAGIVLITVVGREEKKVKQEAESGTDSSTKSSIKSSAESPVKSPVKGGDPS